MKINKYIFFFLMISAATLHGKQFSGYTEPYMTIDASFADDGTVSQVNVKEGDKVKKGEILATLNNSVLQVELKIAQENIHLNQTRFEKLQDLVKKDLATNDEFDRATTELEINRLQADRIRALIERRTIRSPINGIVTNILKDVSEGVSSTEPMLTIVQIDQLIIDLYVDFQDAKLFKLNQMVPITFTTTADAAKGKVIFISPDTDKASRTVRIKLLIDNSSGKYSSGVLGTITL